jgi:FKBP-type peptidyl-prolyl cis-trans isomerase 2|tara:strand:- start:442 stop:927 length:486 start_codon:yes stop_codon:yes gene_type:complete
MKKMTEISTTNSPTLTLHYQGTLESGEEFDSSYERNEPITVTLGNGQLLPAFETNVSTMEEGETKTFTLTSDQAYGDVNPDAKTVISKGVLPEEVDTSDGSKIPLQSRDGRNWMGIVTETQGDEIHLDLNHPLAGKTLTFKVEVLSRTDSTTADLTEETED